MKITYKGVLPENPNPEDVFALLLKNRSVADEYPFLAPPHPTTRSLVDFGFTKEYIEQAMEFIWSKHPKHPRNENPERPLVVYTDYDADGISGGAVLWETLHKLGFKVFPYTPSRLTEGYGFSQIGLDKIKAKYDPSVILSVDHGIVAKSQIAYARHTLGIEVIVTDHHHKQDDQAPIDARAIFHIPALSGSGTAYYVAKEIVQNTQFLQDSSWLQEHKEDIQKVREHFKDDYVGIASIGTIADLVPLVGPSRAIAYYGLRALTQTTRPGLIALKQIADHINKNVTSFEVGFLLAPRINASGRLDDALDALRLLCTQDINKAMHLAHKLDDLNHKRQDMVKKAVSEAMQIVTSQKDSKGSIPLILFVYEHNMSDTSLESDPQMTWHEGIIGLIASKLCDTYYRPVVVLTEGESKDEPIFKASCRSIPGFHMTQYLEQHRDMLLKFGGHEAAAGFSVTQSSLDIFIQRSQIYAKEHITPETLERTVYADCALPLSLATKELVYLINQLEPFGVGNPKPVFVSEGTITDVAFMGKEKQHARFTLGHESKCLECVAFNRAEIISNMQSQEHAYQVAYTLSINTWNGTDRLQAKLVDIAEI